MKHYGDICGLSGYELQEVDCICGGSPCQDISVAGKKVGILEGERSNLFFEQVRIVKEMRERTNGRKPRYMVWENVPAIIGGSEGRQFRKVLQEVIKVSETKAPDLPLPNNGGGGDGQIQDACTMYWGDGALLGEFSIVSFGESPREENASHLSQITVDSVLPKYYLSEKATLGIVKRVEKKKKILPELLKKALILQSGICKEMKSGEEIQQNVKEMDFSQT